MKSNMKFFIVLFAFLIANTLFAQNIKQIDSLSIEMCKSFTALNNMETEKKFEHVLENHLYAYLEKKKVSSQAEADSISSRIYYRLQKNCTVFREMLAELEENKSDWKKLEGKPSTKIQAKDFKSFTKGGNFFYKEYDGEIVNVLVSGNFWTETFEDGTTSKLSFIPKKDGEFDLKFIESNNEKRKNFSVKEEMYYYGIYAKETDGFLIWVKTKENQFLSFKLYSK